MVYFLKELLLRNIFHKSFPLINFMSDRSTYVGYALVVVRNSAGKYLAIEETKDWGWWLIGGHLEYGEVYSDCALWEIEEETGIKAELKGILRFEYSPFNKDTFSHNSIIYYAEPLPEFSDFEKTESDEHSVSSRWMSLEELKLISHWRALDLVHWAEYIEAGGFILPLTFSGIAKTHPQPPTATPFQIVVPPK